MPYDKNLDNQIFSQSWESGNGRVTVSVYSYNDGPKKLQLSRENRNAEGDFRFAKLGRLTKEEVQELLPLIQQALEHL